MEVPLAHITKVSWVKDGLQQHNYAEYCKTNKWRNEYFHFCKSINY